jgi:hypothetical protein
MVNEVAGEMSDGLNGIDVSGQIEAAPVSDAAGIREVVHRHADRQTGEDPDDSARNDYPAPRPAHALDPGDLVGRIEALEELTARQERIFQQLIKLFTATVEKGR